jgi:hypothetical protein
MSNEIIDRKLFPDTSSINTFINNRETWKSLQTQINETLKEVQTKYDAKISELDDRIKFHDDIFKYKLWSCEKYREDQHIPVNDFVRLLEMGLVKTSPDGHEYTSLFLNGGYEYFNGKDGWISKLSSDDYYKVSKAVRQYKKYHMHFDNLILSDVYEENDNYNYLYLLEQLHIKYSNKYLTDKRFEICRKTLILLKEDGLLN